MATLGDLLASARGASQGFQAWLHASDPEIAARVEDAARRTEVSPTGYVRGAIADFSRFASEEDWVTLTSGMRDNADPGLVCLLAMVHWRLTAQGCRSHSHQAAPHAGGTS